MATDKAYGIALREVNYFQILIYLGVAQKYFYQLL